MLVILKESVYICYAVEELKIHKKDLGFPYLRIWNWQMTQLDCLSQWTTRFNEPLGFVLFFCLFQPPLYIFMASGVVLFALRGFDLFTYKLMSASDAITQKNTFLGTLVILCVLPFIILCFPGFVWQRFYGPDSRLPEYKSEGKAFTITRETLQPKKEIVKHKMNYK